MIKYITCGESHGKGIMGILEGLPANFKIDIDFINNELKNPLNIFCYPNGKSIDFGTREIEDLKDTAYMGAVSTTPDFVRYENNNSGDQIYSLPRLALPDNMIDFIQYCSWLECVR